MTETLDLDPEALSAFPDLDPTGNVDLSQVDDSLSLTAAQRVRRLQGFLDFVALTRVARIKRYGFDPATPADPAAAE